MEHVQASPGDGIPIELVLLPYYKILVLALIFGFWGRWGEFFEQTWVPLRSLAEMDIPIEYRKSLYYTVMLTVSLYNFRTTRRWVMRPFWLVVFELWINFHLPFRLDHETYLEKWLNGLLIRRYPMTWKEMWKSLFCHMKRNRDAGNLEIKIWNGLVVEGDIINITSEENENGNTEMGTPVTQGPCGNGHPRGDSRGAILDVIEVPEEWQDHNGQSGTIGRKNRKNKPRVK